MGGESGVCFSSVLKSLVFQFLSLTKTWTTPGQQSGQSPPPFGSTYRLNKYCSTNTQTTYPLSDLFPFPQDNIANQNQEKKQGGDDKVRWLEVYTSTVSASERRVTNVLVCVLCRWIFSEKYSKYIFWFPLKLYDILCDWIHANKQMLWIWIPKRFTSIQKMYLKMDKQPVSKVQRESY